MSTSNKQQPRKGKLIKRNLQQRDQYSSMAEDTASQVSGGHRQLAKRSTRANSETNASQRDNQSSSDRKSSGNGKIYSRTRPPHKYSAEDKEKVQEMGLNLEIVLFDFCLFYHNIMEYQYVKSNLGDSDDSSDEEVLLRTGNVPRKCNIFRNLLSLFNQLKWYELYDHQGYDIKGKAVAKMPEQDELTQFIERQNDKEWWLKITDELNNKQVKLSRGDLELIQRIRSGKTAERMDPNDFIVEFDNEKDFIQAYQIQQRDLK